MIRIEEKVINDMQIAIYVHGRMEGEHLQSLKSVCQAHLDKKKKVVIHFDGLKYINKAGQKYLGEIKSKVELKGLPEFLRMELENSEK